LNGRLNRENRQNDRQNRAKKLHKAVPVAVSSTSPPVQDHLPAFMADDVSAGRGPFPRLPAPTQSRRPQGRSRKPVPAEMRARESVRIRPHALAYNAGDVCQARLPAKSLIPCVFLRNGEGYAGPAKTPARICERALRARLICGLTGSDAALQPSVSHQFTWGKSTGCNVELRHPGSKGLGPRRTHRVRCRGSVEGAGTT
jgi:hypothetical protein